MNGVISLEELRTRGFLEEDFEDGELRAVETIVWETITLFTNRIFENQQLTLNLDGYGIKEQFLPIEIISITSVSESSLGALVEGTDFVTYNRIVPDDRGNSKLVLLSGTWPKGSQNVTIVGRFGYIDPKSEAEHPPLPLIEVAMRMMPIFFENILEDGERDIDLANNKRGIQKEVTDRYSYTKFNRGEIEQQLLEDPFMNAILQRYHIDRDTVSLDFV